MPKFSLKPNETKVIKYLVTANRINPFGGSSKAYKLHIVDRNNILLYTDIDMALQSQPDTTKIYSVTYDNSFYNKGKSDIKCYQPDINEKSNQITPIFCRGEGENKAKHSIGVKIHLKDNSLAQYIYPYASVVWLEDLYYRIQNPELQTKAKLHITNSAYNGRKPYCLTADDQLAGCIINSLSQDSFLNVLFNPDDGESLVPTTSHWLSPFQPIKRKKHKEDSSDNLVLYQFANQNLMDIYTRVDEFKVICLEEGTCSPSDFIHIDKLELTRNDHNAAETVGALAAGENPQYYPDGRLEAGTTLTLGSKREIAYTINKLSNGQYVEGYYTVKYHQKDQEAISFKSKPFGGIMENQDDNHVGDSKATNGHQPSLQPNSKQDDYLFNELGYMGVKYNPYYENALKEAHIRIPRTVSNLDLLSVMLQTINDNNKEYSTGSGIISSVKASKSGAELKIITARHVIQPLYFGAITAEYLKDKIESTDNHKFYMCTSINWKSNKDANPDAYINYPNRNMTNVSSETRVCRNQIKFLLSGFTIPYDDYGYSNTEKSKEYGYDIIGLKVKILDSKFPTPLALKNRPALNLHFGVVPGPEEIQNPFYLGYGNISMFYHGPYKDVSDKPKDIILPLSVFQMDSSTHKDDDKLVTINYGEYCSKCITIKSSKLKEFKTENPFYAWDYHKKYPFEEDDSRSYLGGYSGAPLLVDVFAKPAAKIGTNKVDMVTFYGILISGHTNHNNGTSRMVVLGPNQFSKDMDYEWYIEQFGATGD